MRVFRRSRPRHLSGHVDEAVGREQVASVGIEAFGVLLERHRNDVDVAAGVVRVNQFMKRHQQRGTLRKRSSPWLRSVSFSTARTLVLRWAFANGVANRIRPFLPSRPPKRSISPFASRRSYQTLRWLFSANCHIASRYSRTQSATSARRR